ncbi:helix-turn-helix transcriptional regulator [Pseudomonas sp. MM211]|uniref:ATP-binding protein n=1 Tax=Pseudomonas sp. MM211 TaxID=2866808 RepID=UPI001CECD3A5|nr:winged helix-turn-helix domain-containing protein [Pseudomonas sp. MM211]UCJ18593.1 helix-turn-helix transcriptional regulator [Pseudomonas sp. MM211]
MHDLDTGGEDTVLRFGRFELHPQRRLLLDGDRPLPIGARALDILLVLVESAGKIVSKETIISQVWPKTFVEEINLRVHISALRRALGVCPQSRDYITNVRQRGYSFVAYVEQVSQRTGDLDLQPCGVPSLPGRPVRIEGRDKLIAELTRRLQSRRHISLIGPGGVGKTTVALRVAQQQLGHFRDGVRFVDLAMVSDPAQLPTALVSELGLVLPPGQDAQAFLLATLADRHMLVLLDNCEHLIDACAALCEALLQAAPALRIVATSREALRTREEYVQALAPLDMPPLGSHLRLAAALRYPAVKLLARRIRARQSGFRLRETDVPRVVELCRRLDGLPLAIELAAAQLDTQSLEGILAQLENHSYLSLLGRRTTPARHSSLMASLDWSYALLDAHQRNCLHGLSVCDEYFTVADVRSALAGLPISDSERCGSLSRLVSLSLIGLRRDGDLVYYHMLNSTRAYAAEKRRQAAIVAAQVLPIPA